MNLDTLPVVLSYSGGPTGPGRRPRTEPVSLLVVHCNDGGPQEPLNGAEGLANYLQIPRPPDYPAYHVVVDTDSAIRCAWDTERVNGAGGVNGRAWHLCLYGASAQTATQWADPYSTSELVNAAELIRQAALRFHIPTGTRLTPNEVGAGVRGICGHVDVSAVYPASQGHTDPGPGFPWVKFLELINGQEDDVEHGMAVDSVCLPDGRVLLLDRWGGIHADPPLKFTGGGYWSGNDVARKIVLATTHPVTGYLLDLNGGLHPFAETGVSLPPPRAAGYWKGGKIVPIAEL